MWNDPSRKLHPVVHATKAFLRQLTEEREVRRSCSRVPHGQAAPVTILPVHAWKAALPDSHNAVASCGN